MEILKERAILKSTLWSLLLSIGLGLQAILLIQGQLSVLLTLLIMTISLMFFLIEFDDDKDILGSYRCTLSSLSVLIATCETSSLLLLLVKHITLPALFNVIPIGLFGALSIAMLLMIFNGFLTAKSLESN